MRIENKFHIGQITYLTTDTEQYRRVVVAITVTSAGLCYSLACGTMVSDHYEFEISDEKDIVQTFNT